MQFLPLKMDFVFKFVFTNDLGALASLISSILFPNGDKKLEVIEIISSEIIPIIQINILDFSLLPGESIVSRYLLKEKDSNITLTEDFQMIYVELSKFQKIEIEDLHTESEIWFYLLKNIQNLTEQSRMEILKKKPDLKNAFGVLEMYSSDPEKQREFEERLRADENYAYELAVRYEKGLEKGKLETARKMLEEGDSIEKILRISGLSEDDLRKNGIL